MRACIAYALALAGASAGRQLGENAVPAFEALEDEGFLDWIGAAHMLCVSVSVVASKQPRQNPWWARPKTNLWKRTAGHVQLGLATG